MIIRFVTMTFDPGKMDEFLRIFSESNIKITSFPGCRKLLLLRDVNQKNIFSTYSEWDSVTDLENYRKSELFKITWEKTKKLFVAKPSAKTYEIIC